MELEERFHFPTLEAEERSKMKFLQIRLAALERLYNKAQQTYKLASQNEPPQNFDIFQPFPLVTSNAVQMRGLNSKLRVPSCVLPNVNAPIKTQGSMVPKESPMITKAPRVVKKHENIKVPDFRLISEAENPRIAPTEKKSESVTDEATAQIISTHQQLELVEDMVRIGSETRVTGPASLLRVYNLHEDYKYDKYELKKIHKYQPKEDETYIPKVWPTRVYDSKYTPMSELQEVEVKLLTEDWENSHKASIEAKLAANKRPAKTVKNPKFKVWVGDFITDASEDVTENDDFSLGVN